MVHVPHFTYYITPPVKMNDLQNAYITQEKLHNKLVTMS